MLIADLLTKLGNIPAERIVADPAPGSATEQDLVRVNGRRNRSICELIEGTLVEKSTGFRESILGGRLTSDLWTVAKAGNAGIVVGPGAGARFKTGLVRFPDGAFYSWDRLPGRRIPDDELPQIVPDLAFDFFKVGNTAKEMERKRSDYFKVGTLLVWQIDLRLHIVAVYTRPDNPVVLSDIDVLDGGSVLPGFKLPLSELFGELDRHG